MKIIGFYKPQNTNGYLSNSYPSIFYAENRRFSSVEQYINYRKALLFNDTYYAEKIMATDDVSEIISLSRKINKGSDKVWSASRQLILYTGLMCKFSQNEDLKQQLLSTGTTVIAMTHKMDKVWGIGLNDDDTRIYHMDKWQGTNLLGFTLMEVRRQLSITQ